MAGETVEPRQTGRTALPFRKTTITRHNETVRRAEGGRAHLSQSRWNWRKRILQIFRTRSLSVSELLQRPDYLEHPFSEGPASSPSWYALLVPTHEEGDEVLRTVPELLANQVADFFSHS